MTMSAWAPILTWTCIGLVSLPVSPCALLPAVCVLADSMPVEEVSVVVDQPPVHSCCADDFESKDTPSPAKPASRCPHGCCRLLPVGPTVEKVVAAPLVWNAVIVPHPVAEASGQALLLAPEPCLPAQTLQALSCLWRC
jgi:hypothetical protein